MDFNCNQEEAKKTLVPFKESVGHGTRKKVSSNLEKTKSENNSFNTANLPAVSINLNTCKSLISKHLIDKLTIGQQNLSFY